MTSHTAFLILAIIFLGLVFIVPQMLDFRIKVLNWLRLKKLAGWHDRNRNVITNSVRVLLFVLSIYMFTLAF